MAWKDISSTVINYKDSADSYHSGATALCLQYDDDNVSPTSIKVRFKYYRLSGSGNLHDSIYVLYNPNNYPTTIGRVLYFIKKNTKNSGSTIAWPFYSDSFTITKNYNAETFTLQDLWICNNGNDAVTATASTFYSTARFSGGQYACHHDSQTFSAEKGKTVATEIGKGTITITDNYNNTFSISGAKGAAGDNNPSSGPTISWGYTDSYGTAGAVTNKALTIITPANATRTVYAKCVTGAAFGADTTVTAEKAIKQYVAPPAPGIPSISYEGNRITLKTPWTFSWAASKATNSSSPIKGYRIYLYKNNVLIKGLTIDDNSTLKQVAGGTNEYIDSDTTGTTIKITDPAAFGFVAGDKVKLTIYSYTRYGEKNTGKQLFSAKAAENTFNTQNAGVVQVNINGAWKEGQVYININGAWKEAESISTNVNGVWKESQ